MAREITTIEGHDLTVEEVAGKQTVTGAKLNPNSDTLTIPDGEGLQRIERVAFFCCTSLASITLPEGLQRIEMGAFSGCSSLAEITLPEGLQSIEECAFSECTNLTAITLPEGLQSIGHHIFNGCTNLKEVMMPSYSAVAVERTSFPSNAGLQIVHPELSLPLAFDNFYDVKGSYYKKSLDSLLPLAKASRCHYFFILCIAERINRMVEKESEQEQAAVVVPEKREVSMLVTPPLPLELWWHLLHFVLPEKIADRTVTVFATPNPTFWQQQNRMTAINNWLTRFANAESPATEERTKPLSQGWATV